VNSVAANVLGGDAGEQSGDGEAALGVVIGFELAASAAGFVLDGIGAARGSTALVSPALGVVTVARSSAGFEQPSGTSASASSARRGKPASELAR
jgi:hypothetical protein